MAGELEAVARGEMNEIAARGIVWRELGVEGGFRTAYAALCRWTWRALIERRLDDALKSWHRLLLDVAARVAVEGPKTGDTGDRRRLDAAATSERIRALADLVRLSIDAADASVVEKFTSRAHVLAILRLLSRHAGGALEREKIKDELGLRDANLSRVLTLLAANGLVERMPRGKEAVFRATQRGMGIVEASAEKTKPRFYETGGGVVIDCRVVVSSTSQQVFSSSILHKSSSAGGHGEFAHRLYRPQGEIHFGLVHVGRAKE